MAKGKQGTPSRDGTKESSKAPRRGPAKERRVRLQQERSLNNRLERTQNPGNFKTPWQLAKQARKERRINLGMAQLHASGKCNCARKG
jgi:hypothetical protein